MEAHSQEKVAAAAKAAQETAAEAAATVAEAERRAAEAAAAHDRVLQEVGEELMARIKVRPPSSLGCCRRQIQHTLSSRWSTAVLA